MNHFNVQIGKLKFLVQPPSFDGRLHPQRPTEPSSMSPSALMLTFILLYSIERHLFDIAGKTSVGDWSGPIVAQYGNPASAVAVPLAA
jgi:hypothetical protein